MCQKWLDAAQTKLHDRLKALPIKALYLPFTWLCRQGSETPTTLAIPAKEIFSHSSLSIKALASELMRLFFGS